MPEIPDPAKENASEGADRSPVRSLIGGAREGLSDLLDARFRGHGNPDNGTLDRILAAAFPDVQFTNQTLKDKFFAEVRHRAKGLRAPGEKDVSFDQVLQAMRAELQQGRNIPLNDVLPYLEGKGLVVSDGNPAAKEFRSALKEFVGNMRSGSKIPGIASSKLDALGVSLLSGAPEALGLSPTDGKFLQLKKVWMRVQRNEEILRSGQEYWRSVDDIPPERYQSVFDANRSAESKLVKDEELWGRIRRFLRDLHKTRSNDLIDAAMLAHFVEVGVQGIGHGLLQTRGTGGQVWQQRLKGGTTKGG